MKTKVNASALYIVIVISLVIGIVCAALVASAFFYKLRLQQKDRFDKLDDNLESAINVVLASPDTVFESGRIINLFNNGDDSVYVEKKAWGIYTVAIVKAFSQKDTLFRVFSIGNAIDSTKWACLYLADDDRPFLVSGKTLVEGDVFIPKSHVEAAVVNGIGYEGDKRLIIGSRHNSAKILPPLSLAELNVISGLFKSVLAKSEKLPQVDSLVVSFRQPVRVFNFNDQVKLLSGDYFAGNVILYSDTTITLDSTASLKDILVVAPTIIVKSGFRGTCQLFARDSISVGNNSNFDYPSCLGVFRMDSVKNRPAEKISFGKNSRLDGTIITYEKASDAKEPMVVFGNNDKIKGQIYSQGITQLCDGLEIEGSLFTRLLLFRTGATMLLDCAVNTNINSKSLSPYYLTGKMLPTAGASQKILQWLEQN